MLKRIRLFFVFISLLVLVCMALAGNEFYLAKQYTNPQKKTLTIKKGSSVKEISLVLERQKIIRRQWDFLIYLKLAKNKSFLKAGEYIFDKGLNLKQVVNKLISGKVKLYKYTIPEGYNIKDVCAVLINKKLMSSNECHRQVTRVGLLKEANGIKNLEGYLFPETYSYEPGITPDKITEQMVKHFYKKLGEKKIIQAKKLGFSVHELVTFASVVEKETGVASERPLIAGVFHNRLKKGMLLQSDPTVIYGIKDFDGNIKRSHLKENTPYNTYTRPGLPVGPICNPGIESINAVLNPDQTSFLYFVAKGGGRHYFSKTLAEHNRAVQYYQLKRGPKPQDNTQ